MSLFQCGLSNINISEKAMLCFMPEPQHMCTRAQSRYNTAWLSAFLKIGWRLAVVPSNGQRAITSNLNTH